MAACLVALAAPAAARRSYPENPAARLAPELKERIYRIGTSHPTLDDKQLAAALARAPGLAGVTRWSAAEVRRLRTLGALPTVPRRNEILAELSARFLERQPRSVALETAVGRIASKHTGVTVDSLIFLGRYHPKLARSLLARLAQKPRPEQPVVQLTAAQALALPLSRIVLERVLSQPSSTTVQRVRAALERVDRTIGNGSGQLAPDRHIDRTEDPALQRVMDQVYRKTQGRHTLSIDRIVEMLPGAIAVATKPRPSRWGPARPQTAPVRDLYVNTVREAVEVLAADYKAKVIDGPLAPENFREAWAIDPIDWAKLIRALPDQFIAIERLPLDERRVVAVAGAYRQLLAGELTSRAFYYRTGVSSDMLALLQAARPKLFPRQEGAPSYKPIARGHDRKAAANAVARIDAALAEQEGKQGSLKEVVRATGISQAQYDRLRRAERAASPRARAVKNTPELARLLGDRASAIFQRDIFVESDDVVRELNADPAFLERIGGELDHTRYGKLRALASDRFPPLGHSPENERAVSERLASEVSAIKSSGGSLAIKDLTAALQQRYPRLKAHRLERLRKTRPELFVAPEQRRSPAYRRRDAQRLAVAMRRGDASAGEAADQLRERQPRFTREYAYSLRSEFATERFFQALGLKRDRRRATLPINEVARLLLELSPPGVSDTELMTRVNSWLEARGLPAYVSKTSGGPLKPLYREGAPVRARNARVVSEIVAEYTAMAPPGTGEEAILAEVQRDYPLLKQIELGRYRALWEERPQDFPALAVRTDPAARRELRKRPPRYRGGWDPERAVLEAASRDPALAERLARLTQYTRIPARLPLLEKLVAELGGKKPLGKHNLLMVSHLLGSTVALTDALRAAGISVERSIIVGTPYGSNEAVVSTLRNEGFKVRVPPLSPARYQKEVERAVRELAERYRNDPRKKPILVLDDGGLVTQFLHNNQEEFADVLPAFRIVEQTTRGITLAQRTALKMPVLDVPDTECKKAEGRFIGKAVAAKVVQALRRQGTGLARRRVVIIGNGVVGAAVGRAISAAEPTAEIVYVERNRRRAAAAARDYKLMDKESAIASADVVIGATGEESLHLEDLRRLKNGAVIVSASSKRLEFALGELEGIASRREVRSTNPLVKLPSARYRFDGKTILALGDGWPINFDGDVEDIAPEHIQITRALMFASALQVAGMDARFEKNQRLVKLDPKTDRRLMRLFKPYLLQSYSRDGDDPGHWADRVRELLAN